MEKNYQEHIDALSAEIEKCGDMWELYNERGFWYFLNGEEEKAKADYRKAMEFGLDPLEQPYYAFSTNNSRRREFLLPEKIMVFLLLIMVLVALFFQLTSFIINIKAAL